MTHAPPTPGFSENFYQPRKVRVSTGIQTCMRCGKPTFRTTLQAGWSFMTCEHKRCDMEWWSLALPPDAFAGLLASLVGDDAARAIVRKAFPESRQREGPDFWAFPLNPGNETAWIQVAVRPRERHLHRTSKITQLVHAFLL